MVLTDFFWSLTLTVLQSILSIEAREIKACHALVQILQWLPQLLTVTSTRPGRGQPLQIPNPALLLTQVPRGFLSLAKSQLQDPTHLPFFFFWSCVLIRFCLTPLQN